MNKAILLGRLTRDPEVRYTQSNVMIANFTLAVDRRFSRQGEERQTDFIPIVTFNKTAEFCDRYLKKGQQVVVVGRIQTRSWDDSEGKKRYVTEIISDEVHFADSKRPDSGEGGGGRQQEDYGYFGQQQGNAGGASGAGGYGGGGYGGGAFGSQPGQSGAYGGHSQPYGSQSYRGGYGGSQSATSATSAQPAYSSPVAPSAPLVSPDHSLAYTPTASASAYAPPASASVPDPQAAAGSVAGSDADSSPPATPPTTPPADAPTAPPTVTNDGFTPIESESDLPF